MQKMLVGNVTIKEEYDIKIYPVGNFTQEQVLEMYQQGLLRLCRNHPNFPNFQYVIISTEGNVVALMDGFSPSTKEYENLKIEKIQED